MLTFTHPDMSRANQSQCRRTRFSSAMIDNLSIINPKRRRARSKTRDDWFPYYASFSAEFAREIIRTSQLDPGSTIMDPWNGSGTTTAAASVYGYSSIGIDLNPVMAVAARARLLPRAEAPSVVPLLANIEKKASMERVCNLHDPLLEWFTPSAASGVRSIDRAIQALLVEDCPIHPTFRLASGLSAIAAFFYVALLRSVRALVAGFTRSNPTWIRRRIDAQNRVNPSVSELKRIFARQVRAMLETVDAEFETPDFIASKCSLSVASSQALPLATNSVDFVLTSPPYCTRLDYGIATSPELAALGFQLGDDLAGLRKRLIGTPTIQDVVPRADRRWGRTCNAFLKRLHNHPTKAARSYYYKTYVQYFSGISDSFSELARCIRVGAPCVVVVQDSYFKDIRVQLAQIVNEIADGSGMTLSRQVDFPISRSFLSINTKSRAYRSDAKLTESILCFTRSKRDIACPNPQTK
jgi:hypothetical protein